MDIAWTPYSHLQLSRQISIFDLRQSGCFNLIMKKTMLLIIILLPLNLYANCFYYICGDGFINISNPKNKTHFKGRYRNPDGTYSEIATEKINDVFGANPNMHDERISFRLIELLAYISDSTKSSEIQIVSGYRSPTYNKSLRNKGRLAAKASLHQYGMAADVIMPNVPASKIATFTKKLHVGGVGYYHGKTVHIDTGPPRHWDGKSSGVGSGAADDNKLVIITTDKDIYKQNDLIRIKVSRITALPITLNGKAILIDRLGNRKKLNLGWKKCRTFSSIKDLSQISLRLPKKSKTSKYNIEVSFCDKDYPKMPKNIKTRNFVIIKD